MPDFHSKWLVETDWLEDRLSAPGLAIMDASMNLAGAPQTAHQSYEEAHIPGALFFDIDDLSDTASPLPNMLPSPEKFASRMRKMGIGDGMKIVVYDTKGIYTAPRAWWMFRVMGHTDVAVLNGGFAKWRTENRSVEQGLPAPRSDRHFTARKNSALVRDLNDMKQAVAHGAPQIADARSSGRFEGTEPEPRPVPRRGHMPGAHNVPYSLLTNENGTLKSALELQSAFASAGIDPGKPTIASCGSGITACTLALALAVLGNDHAAVYDGSWSEWTHASDAPVEAKS